MLVISRKVEQGLHIGDEIEIKVLDIFSLDSSGGRSGRVVSIGINAPAHVKILRKELYDTCRENRAAGESVRDLSAVNFGRMLRGKF